MASLVVIQRQGSSRTRVTLKLGRFLRLDTTAPNVISYAQVQEAPARHRQVNEPNVELAA